MVRLKKSPTLLEKGFGSRWVTSVSGDGTLIGSTAAKVGAPSSGTGGLVAAGFADSGFIV